MQNIKTASSMRNALKGKVIIMSVNGKYEYKIEIDTMEDAKNLVAISTKLKGKIVLKSGTKFSVNAKSLLGVLSLGITKGTTINVIADGIDEEDAVNTLVNLIASNFTE